MKKINQYISRLRPSLNIKKRKSKKEDSKALIGRGSSSQDSINTQDFKVKQPKKRFTWLKKIKIRFSNGVQEHKRFYDSE